MSNRLSMAKIQSIESLHLSGRSNSEIARLLSVDRGTVNVAVRRLKATGGSERFEFVGRADSRPANPAHRVAAGFHSRFG